MDQRAMQKETQTSKVVHIRNLPNTATENDIMQLTSKYGTVSKIILMKNKYQALVEYANLVDSQAFIIEMNMTNSMFLGSRIYVQYSKYQSLDSYTTKTTPAAPSFSEPEPSRVLLATIMNVKYVIDVNVISQVFSPFETNSRRTVEKVIVFRKPAGLHALVQFSNLASAAKAKNELEGKNIYTGCCTLHVTYSVEKELEITENSELARDFTNPSLPYKKTPSESFQIPSADSSAMGPRGRDNRPVLSSTGIAAVQTSAAASSSSRMLMGMMLPDSSLILPHSVVLVSNVPAEKMSITEIFNLFSNYGIIKRVKVIHSDHSKVLVQFTSPDMARSAISNLHGCTLFGSTLSVVASKFDTIQTPIPKAGGGDGLTVDFQETKLNRYKFGSEFHTKGMNVRPTAVLHVSNLSSLTTEDKLKKHFEEKQPHPVRGIRMIEIPSASSASSSSTPSASEKVSTKKMALIEFESSSQASEVLCTVHNTSLDGMTLRVSFATNKL
eukprot:MONOS_2064.2-p1 / transcript=MONOS_2064.2 / gene=MONOS_2064 / organism=Monocercomonoides_exilis_PA203 / gene_product=RNA recognition domain containing protein,expressed / transcript_product=RNA recognition domain containing protein,expressed / location=Mono_scaffold00040:89512-91314(+) / protein_length=497 / sequence_SO=supercontig / SO=protein_coding / is_pseudo=false